MKYSFGWRFWIAIAIAVCVGFIDACRHAINEYLSDRGGSQS